MKSVLLVTALVVLSLALVLVGPRPTAAQGVYLVIVNPSVSVDHLSAPVLSDLFLKKTERWPDRSRVFPVDQIETAAARAAFSRDVHGRTVAAIKSYWQQKIFSGRDVPPPEKGSDREVVEFVRATPGAVGYVTPGTSLSGVKTLRVER